MKIVRSQYLILIASILLCACSPVKELVYFQEGEGFASKDIRTIEAAAELKIQANDVLEINVYNNKYVNLESANPFNQGNSTAGEDGSTATNVYRVDNDGNINFPLIGKLLLIGISLEEAQKLIIEKVTTYFEEPVVNIRLLNFKITIIGEVNSPSSVQFETNKVTILDALGAVGDLTKYARRDNILIMREQDGVRNFGRVNLNSKEVFDSPYFYLRQNDFIYVEPQTKTYSAERNSQIVPWISAASSFTALLVTLIVR